MKENISLKGSLKLVLYNPVGEVLLVRRAPNLIVAYGGQFVASRMKDDTAPVMTHMALGDDNTTPDVTDIGLSNELGRVALTSTNVSGNKITYSAVFGAGVATGNVVEAGIFDGTGNMLNHSVFGVITKDADFVLGVDWEIEVILAP